MKVPSRGWRVNRNNKKNAESRIPFGTSGRSKFGVLAASEDVDKAKTKAFEVDANKVSMTISSSDTTK